MRTVMAYENVMERTGSNIINEILDGGYMKTEQKFKTTEKLNVGH